jgi:hypothetical protein
MCTFGTVTPAWGMDGGFTDGTLGSWGVLTFGGVAVGTFGTAGARSGTGPF